MLSSRLVKQLYISDQKHIIGKNILVIPGVLNEHFS